MAVNLNQYLEEFRQLNPKDPGTWPLVPKIVVLLVILILIPVAGFFLDTQGQLEQLEAGRAQEVKLKDDYLNKKRLAVNLDLYKQQLREIDTQFGALLKQLPGKSEMDALLTDINQAGLGRGLQFELFKPAAEESTKEFYAERPITIRITGSYHDLGAFASDIGKLSRIVTLNDISLAASKGDTLVMDATAKTFRYLDDEEIAAQRKKDKDKKGPAK